MKETFLLEGFPVTSPRGFLGWANALLLDDGTTRVVVDTGGPGDRGTLIRRMQEIGLDPDSIRILILTHLHFDHCLNLDLFLHGSPSAEARATLERVRPLAERWIPGHDRPFIVEGSTIHYESSRELEIQVLRDPRWPPASTRWRFE